MTTPYMFLTLIIPSPHNLKGKIDVYLQPLTDELKLLWNEDAFTYDISKKTKLYYKSCSNVYYQCHDPARAMTEA